MFDVVRTIKGIPLLRHLAHRIAVNYSEHSISTIRVGLAKGLKCKRTHRYCYAFWTGHYDLPVQNILRDHLHDGDCFYDIGANAGFFSICAARLVGSEGHVFAFEPSPQEATFVRNWLDMNHITNCTVVEAAISDRTSKALFKLEQESSMSHLDNEKEPVADHQIVVNTICLDDFIIDRPIPRLIKIDVEGAEYRVLNGARTCLSSKSRPKILLELHKNVSFTDVASLLRDYGYHSFQAVHQNKGGANNVTYFIA